MSSGVDFTWFYVISPSCTNNHHDDYDDNNNNIFTVPVRPVRRNPITLTGMCPRGRRAAPHSVASVGPHLLRRPVPARPHLVLALILPCACVYTLFSLSLSLSPLPDHCLFILSRRPRLLPGNNDNIIINTLRIFFRLVRHTVQPF